MPEDSRLLLKQPLARPTAKTPTRARSRSTPGLSWRRVGVQACVVLGSLVATLLVLELAFRWSRWRRGMPSERSVHSTLHHLTPPNLHMYDTTPDFHVLVTSNAMSLRGTTEYGKKPPGVKRLLMVGDSFTFGVGVESEETFSALLQQKLDARGAKIQVINGGVGSYSPILEYLILRDRYLDWLEPDAVMLWFDFNDLQDDFFYERHLRYDAQGRLLGCDPRYVNGRFDWYGFLRQRSALVGYFHDKLLRPFEKLRLLGWRGYLESGRSGVQTKVAIMKMTGDRRRIIDPLNYDTLLMIRDRSLLPEIEAHWKLTGGYLLKIRDLLQARGIPFVLAAFPMGTQVGPDQWRDGRLELGFEPGVTYDDPFPFEFLEAFADSHQIPFLNTSPAFVAARREQLFHHADGHFTPAGHRVIAETLPHDPVFLGLLKRLAARR